MNEISRDLALFFVVFWVQFRFIRCFVVISTVSAQHHQYDPITLVKAIFWIHYSITCKNLYAVIPSEYVGNSLSQFHDISGLYVFNESSFIQLCILINISILFYQFEWKKNLLKAYMNYLHAKIIWYYFIIMSLITHKSLL